MKRAFDIIVSMFLFLVLGLPFVVVAILVKLTSAGPLIYWSDRIGKDNRIFRMPKFRTMRIDTPEVASHLLTDPDRWFTPVGSLLRRTSLDELPQLWSVLVGDMSFVGPRPALHNQDDLIALRTLKRVHLLTPGITGWAQINGRDETPIPQKVTHDAYYLEHQSLWLDFKIIAITLFQVVRRKGTSVPAGIRGQAQGETIPPEAFLASGANWFNQGDYHRALSAYDRAVQTLIEPAIALNNRGVVWAAKGEYEKAIADLNESIRFAPQFEVAHRNRAFVWSEMAEEEKARIDLDTAERLSKRFSARASTQCGERDTLPLLLNHTGDEVAWKWTNTNEEPCSCSKAAGRLGKLSM